MTFLSHQLIGAATASVLGYDYLSIALVTAGSIMPDVFDRAASFKTDALFNLVHRKMSHWWLIYVVALVITKMQLLPWDNVNYYVFCLSLGSILHIICDAMTEMGVPVLNPIKLDFRLKWFRVGSFKEYVISFAYALPLLYSRFHSELF